MNIIERNRNKSTRLKSKKTWVRMIKPKENVFYKYNEPFISLILPVLVGSLNKFTHILVYFPITLIKLDLLHLKQQN